MDISAQSVVQETFNSFITCSDLFISRCSNLNKITKFSLKNEISLLRIINTLSSISSTCLESVCFGLIDWRKKKLTSITAMKKKKKRHLRRLEKQEIKLKRKPEKYELTPELLGSTFFLNLKYKQKLEELATEFIFIETSKILFAEYKGESSDNLITEFGSVSTNKIIELIKEKQQYKQEECQILQLGLVIENYCELFSILSYHSLPLITLKISQLFKDSKIDNLLLSYLIKSIFLDLTTNKNVKRCLNFVKQILEITKALKKEEQLIIYEALSIALSKSRTNYSLNYKKNKKINKNKYTDESESESESESSGSGSDSDSDSDSDSESEEKKKKKKKKKKKIIKEKDEEIDFKEWYETIESIYQIGMKMSKKNKGKFVAIQLLTSCLLNCSIAFLKKNLDSFLKLMSKTIKIKGIKKITLKSLTIFIQSYLQRFGNEEEDEKKTTKDHKTMKKDIKQFLNEILKKFFPINKKVLFFENQGEILIKFGLITCQWNLEFGIKNILLPLLKPQKAFPERVSIGLKLLRKLLNNNKQKNNNSQYRNNYYSQNGNGNNNTATNNSTTNNSNNSNNSNNNLKENFNYEKLKKFKKKQKIEIYIELDQKNIELIEESVLNILEKCEEQVGNCLIYNLKSNETVAKEKIAYIKVLIEFNKNLTNIFPNAQKTLLNLIKNTVHIDPRLCITSFNSLYNFILNEESLRCYIIREYLKFILSIPFKYSSLINYSLKHLHKLIICWKNLTIQELIYEDNDMDIDNLSFDFKENKKFKKLDVEFDLSRLEGWIVFFLTSNSPKVRLSSFKLLEDLKQLNNELVKLETKNIKDTKLNIRIYKNQTMMVDLFFSKEDEIFSKEIDNNCLSILDLPALSKKKTKFKKLLDILVERQSNDFQNNKNKNNDHYNLLKKNQLKYEKEIIENTNNTKNSNVNKKPFTRYLELLSSNDEKKTLKWFIIFGFITKLATEYCPDTIHFAFFSILETIKSLKLKISKKNLKSSSKNQQRKKLRRNINQKLINLKNLCSIASACCDPRIIDYQLINEFLELIINLFKSNHNFYKDLIIISLSNSHSESFDCFVKISNERLINQIINKKRRRKSFHNLNTLTPSKRDKDRKNSNTNNSRSTSSSSTNNDNNTNNSNIKKKNENEIILSTITTIYKQFLLYLKKSALNNNEKLRNLIYNHLINLSKYFSKYSIKNEFIFVNLRYNFFYLLRLFIDLTYKRHPLSLKDRKLFFDLLFQYCGIGRIGLQKRSSDFVSLSKLLENKIKNPLKKMQIQEIFNNQTNSVEFLAIQAISSLLKGEQFFDENLLEKHSQLFNWIYNLIELPNPYIKFIGIESLQILFEFNYQKLIDLFLIENYGINPNWSLGFSLALIKPLKDKSIKLTNPQLLNFILYNFDSTNPELQFQITQLYRNCIDDLIPQNELQKNVVPVINSHFCTIPEKINEERNSINRFLARTLPTLSFQIFKEGMFHYWELEKKLLQNITSENIDIVLKKKESILTYLIPWIKNIKYEKENKESTLQFQEIFTNLMKITMRDVFVNLELGSKIWQAFSSTKNNIYGIIKIMFANGIGELNVNYLRASKQIALYLSKTLTRSFVQILLRSEKLQDFRMNSNQNIYKNIINDDQDENAKGSGGGGDDGDGDGEEEKEEEEEDGGDDDDDGKKKKGNDGSEDDSKDSSDDKDKGKRNKGKKKKNKKNKKKNKKKQKQKKSEKNRKTKNRSKSQINKKQKENEKKTHKEEGKEKDMSEYMINRSDFVIILLSNLVHVATHDFHQKLPLILHLVILGLDHKLKFVREESKILLSNVIINLIIKSRSPINMKSQILARQLLDSLNTKEKDKFWESEQVNKMNITLKSEKRIRKFLDKIILLFSIIEPKLVESWIEESFDWCLWKDYPYKLKKNVQVIARSHQIYRFLIKKVDITHVKEILNNLYFSFVNLKNEFDCYSTNIIENIKTLQTLLLLFNDFQSYPDVYWSILFFLQSKNIEIYNVVLVSIHDFINKNFLFNTNNDNDNDNNNNNNNGYSQEELLNNFKIVKNCKPKIFNKKFKNLNLLYPLIIKGLNYEKTFYLTIDILNKLNLINETDLIENPKKKFILNLFALLPCLIKKFDFDSFLNNNNSSSSNNIQLQKLNKHNPNTTTLGSDSEPESDLDSDSYLQNEIYNNYYNKFYDNNYKFTIEELNEMATNLSNNARNNEFDNLSTILNKYINNEYEDEDEFYFNIKKTILINLNEDLLVEIFCFLVEMIGNSNRKWKNSYYYLFESFFDNFDFSLLSIKKDLKRDFFITIIKQLEKEHTKKFTKILKSFLKHSNYNKGLLKIDESKFHYKKSKNYKRQSKLQLKLLLNKKKFDFIEELENLEMLSQNPMEEEEEIRKKIENSPVYVGIKTYPQLVDFDNLLNIRKDLKEKRFGKEKIQVVQLMKSYSKNTLSKKSSRNARSNQSIEFDKHLRTISGGTSNLVGNENNTNDDEYFGEEDSYSQETTEEDMNSEFNSYTNSQNMLSDFGSQDDDIFDIFGSGDEFENLKNQFGGDTLKLKDSGGNNNAGNDNDIKNNKNLDTIINILHDDNEEFEEVDRKKKLNELMNSTENSEKLNTNSNTRTQTDLESTSTSTSSSTSSSDTDSDTESVATSELSGSENMLIKQSKNIIKIKNKSKAESRSESGSEGESSENDFKRKFKEKMKEINSSTTKRQMEKEKEKDKEKEKPKEKEKSKTKEKEKEKKKTKTKGKKKKHANKKNRKKKRSGLSRSGTRTDLLSNITEPTSQKFLNKIGLLLNQENEEMEINENQEFDLLKKINKNLSKDIDYSRISENIIDNFSKWNNSVKITKFIEEAEMFSIYNSSIKLWNSILSEYFYIIKKISNFDLYKQFKQNISQKSINTNTFNLHQYRLFYKKVADRKYKKLQTKLIQIKKQDQKKFKDFKIKRKKSIKHLEQKRKKYFSALFKLKKLLNLFQNQPNQEKSEQQRLTTLLFESQLNLLLFYQQFIKFYKSGNQLINVKNKKANQWLEQIQKLIEINKKIEIK
ncbi:furry-related [Anaeramoeba flamelloides]|uniref:Furry-related n=1 Tax=Anaeramoeba flamelloides TaxID=1746091 RepID=A0AAV7YKQ5_9EUKA|nr:furry-related [Anaeramoeba flamelloides]